MSQYIHFPPSGGVPTYTNLAAFPASATAGALGIALNTGVLYEYFSSAWTPISGTSTVLSIGTLDSASPSANGAVISSNSLKLQSASATAPGLVNNSSQTLSGNKTLSGQTSMSQFLTVTNASVAGTPSSPTLINTGDPNTKGLVVRAGIYNPTGFGPANPTMQDLTGGITYNAGILTSIPSGTSWDQGCRTVESFTNNGYVEWSAPNDYFAGLSTSFVGSPPLYPAIDFSVLSQSGLLYVYENGVQIGGSYGSVISTDIIRVERSGTDILYKKNGVTFYTSGGVSVVSVLFGSFNLSGPAGVNTIEGITMFYGAVVPQASNLLEIQDSSSVNLVSVTANGTLVVPGIITANNIKLNTISNASGVQLLDTTVGSVSITVSDNRTDYVKLLLVGTASQTAHIFDCWDNGGGNLFSVDAAGNALAGGTVSGANSRANGRYFSSVSAISGSLATVKYATQGFDLQSAYNAATGVWTCQTAGKYQFNAAVATAGTIALNSALDIQIQQGGSASQISESLTDGAAGLTNLSGSVSDVFNCAVGDTIQVQVSSGATGPSIVASNTRNYFSWSWIGV